MTRALAVYAGTAFALLQGADIFTNQLGLPDWFFRGMLVLLLVGLVLVVATAHRYARRARAAEPGAQGARADTEPLESTGASGARPEKAGVPGRRPLLTWRRLTWGGVMAMAGWGLVVALFMGMRSLGIGPAGSLVGAGVLDVRERVILSEFQSRTGDTLLAAAATEAFRIDLSQSPIVNIVEPEYVSRVLARMQRDPGTPLDVELAREIALREGINAVISGEINAVGAGFVLSARLVAAETGEILAGFRETAADSSAIIASIDRLSKRMRERVGESLRTIRGNEPLASVTTPSLEALRKYSQGVRARDEGDFTRARALLEEAVAIDTAFAMAWRKLGLTGLQPAEQARALARAYELRDRLTDRERYLTMGTYYAHVTHETERAITAYRTLLYTHPDDSWALNNLAILYRDLRDYERAEELFARAIAADSLAATSLINLATVQFAQGKVDDARSTIDLFGELFPHHPAASQQRVALAAALGDYEETERLIRDATDARRSEPQVRLMTAESRLGVALVRGRLEDAEREARELAALAPELGFPVMVPGLKLGLAFQQFWFHGNAAGTLEAAAAVLEEYPLETLDPLDRPYIGLAQIYAFAGDIPRAREMLEAYEAVHAPVLRGNAALARESTLGIIALADGRPGEAVESFRRTDAGPCPICALPLLGLALEEAGEPDSALVHYERYLATPWLQRIQVDMTFLPIVYERLGALYEERDQRAEAARYYSRFVELWAEADPALQPRVDAARAALRRLAGDGTAEK